jgi:hypothetical protein
MTFSAQLPDLDDFPGRLNAMFGSTGSRNRERDGQFGVFGIELMKSADTAMLRLILGPSRASLR